MINTNIKQLTAILIATTFMNGCFDSNTTKSTVAAKNSFGPIVTQVPYANTDSNSLEYKVFYHDDTDKAGNAEIVRIDHGKNHYQKFYIRNLLSSTGKATSPIDTESTAVAIHGILDKYVTVGQADFLMSGPNIAIDYTSNGVIIDKHTTQDSAPEIETSSDSATGGIVFGLSGATLKALIAPESSNKQPATPAAGRDEAVAFLKDARTPKIQAMLMRRYYSPEVVKAHRTAATEVSASGHTVSICFKKVRLSIDYNDEHAIGAFAETPVNADDVLTTVTNNKARFKIDQKDLDITGDASQQFITFNLSTSNSGLSGLQDPNAVKYYPMGIGMALGAIGDESAAMPARGTNVETTIVLFNRSVHLALAQIPFYDDGTNAYGSLSREDLITSITSAAPFALSGSSDLPVAPSTVFEQKTIGSESVTAGEEAKHNWFCTIPHAKP